MKLQGYQIFQTTKNDTYFAALKGFSQTLLLKYITKRLYVREKNEFHIQNQRLKIYLALLQKLRSMT